MKCFAKTLLLYLVVYVLYIHINIHRRIDKPTLIIWWLRTKIFDMHVCKFYTYIESILSNLLLWRLVYSCPYHYLFINKKLFGDALIIIETTFQILKHIQIRINNLKNIFATKKGKDLSKSIYKPKAAGSTSFEFVT